MTSDFIPEINREPLKVQAANYFRHLILTNSLNSGDRIVPGNIASDLKIGRGVIREALMQLETEGLVTNVPYSGSYVTSYTMNEIQEIGAVRIMLEAYAIKNQYEHITEEDFVCLEQICDRIKECVFQNNIEGVLKYDAMFHSYFVRKENKSVLLDSWDVSSGKMALIYVAMHQKGYSSDNTAKNHYYLLDKLRSSLDEYLDELDEHYMKVVRYKPE